tara:strand:- start:166 stop:480 length:315 start_codon:yes stop_codon:yes gene_type:complete
MSINRRTSGGGGRTKTRVITKIIERPDDHKLVNLENLECCVCGGKDYLVKTHCHHFVCLGCFTNLQKPECPLTRRPFENIPDKIKVILPWYQPPETIEYDSDEV